MDVKLIFGNTLVMIMVREKIRSATKIMIFWFIAIAVAYTLIQPLPVVVDKVGYQEVNVTYHTLFWSDTVPNEYLVDLNTHCAVVVDSFWHKLNLFILYQFITMFILLVIFHKR